MADDVAGTRGGFYAEEGRDASLEQYRTLVNAVDDGLYQLDPDGRFVAVNDVICATAGYDRSELVGRHVSLLLDDQDVARIDAMLHSMLTHDLDGTPIDLAVETKSGDRVPCELLMSVIETEDGFEGTVGIVRDVTGRSDLDGSVTAATGRYESLVKDVLDGAAVGVVVVDADGTVTWVNEATERYFGLDRRDVIGRSERAVVEETLEDAVADPAGFRAAHAATGEERDVEFQIVPGDLRAHRWLAYRSNPIETGQYAGGRVDLYYDVTERKQSEQVARDRERRLHEEQAFTESLLDAQGDIVYAVDASGRPLRWNDRLNEVTGYSDAEIAWLNALDCLTEESRERALEAFEPVVEDGERVTAELSVVTADGEAVPYQFSGTPLTDEAGDIVGVTGIGRDVSRLKAQARRLERQRDDLESELQDVFDRIDDAFFALDDRCRFTYLNDRAEELLSVRGADVIGGDVRDVDHVSPQAVEAITTAYETQTPQTVEAHVADLDAWIRSHVYPSETGVSVYFRDVTEREERKRELAEQRERLAALDDLNGVVRQVTDAVLEQSTREEIERAVVDGLVDSESYAAAWIGATEPGQRGLAVQAVAGRTVADECDQSMVEPADGDGGLPAHRALQTGEIQVCLGTERDCTCAPVDPEIEGGSAAAIPITHRENSYGVLTIHTERTGAFSAEEREVIGQLGEIVGHAIASIERKRALTCDEVIEVEFLIDGFLSGLPGIDEPVDGVAFEQTIPVGDGQYHLYGTATETGLAALETIPEALDSVTDVRAVSRDGDLAAFELRQTEPPISTALAAHGGTVSRAVVEDGTFRLTVQVPPGVRVRTVKETVQDGFPDASLVAQRQVTRSDETAHRVLSALETDLTDRQRVVLQTSYFGGYFEWPRGSTGEELAESLDIAPATFSQHLRTAQRRLFSVLFGDDHDEMDRLD